jgi:hypothetical protein
MDGYQPRSSFRNRRPAPRKDDGRPKCVHCGKPVRWAYPVIPRGRGKRPAYADKPKPFDWEPDTNGRFVLSEGPRPLDGDGPDPRPFYTELRPLQAKGWREDGKPTYTAHFQNCPKKDDWGKQGKAYGNRTITR